MEYLGEWKSSLRSQGLINPLTWLGSIRHGKSGWKSGWNALQVEGNKAIGKSVLDSLF